MHDAKRCAHTHPLGCCTACGQATDSDHLYQTRYWRNWNERHLLMLHNLRPRYFALIVAILLPAVLLLYPWSRMNEVRFIESVRYVRD